ncbi:MAG: amino acid-binding protein [Eggerthellaceae bacterium]|nr:amino acid-binding protein [Eggerthellaceae bacterium]
MIFQLTVFLENRKGRLYDLCNTIEGAGINMKALFLSDTQDYGVVRVFCDRPEYTSTMLNEKGFQSTTTPVIAVHIPDEIGSLAKLLKICDEKRFNIEYGYCFAIGNDLAVDVLRIEEPGAEEELAKAGFDIVDPSDLYEVG